MKASTVRVAQDGYVRTITLDRPDQLNAMSNLLMQELAQALNDASTDADTRCVVLTGAGRAFCAGRDISELGEVEAHDVFAPALNLTTPMTESGKIFIAAINGPVAGAALGLIMAADFRVASASATFTPGFITLALAPDVGASLIGRAIGYAKALEFLLLGQKVSAAEALNIGLVNRVFAPDAFSDEVAAFAKAIGALPPRAVLETKRLLQRAGATGAIELLWAEAEAAARLVKTDDHREGVRAFVERRMPAFQGR